MTTPVADAVHATLGRTRLRRDKRPLVLLMFSGGLDGTVLLSTLLEHTDVDVHVHHIALDNADGRVGAEQAATDAVLAFCERHHRPFAASSSTHRFEVDGRMGGTDTELAMFTAARVCHALVGKVDVVMTGHMNSGYTALAHAEAVFHASFFYQNFRPPWMRPLARLTGEVTDKKRAIWASAPAELTRLAWWCRRPVENGDGWRRCERCLACEIMGEVLEGTPS
jgi:hypothetical protein